MQTIIEYYKHLKTVTPFVKRYPNYDLHDKKVHVLYVNPKLRSEEYYSSILPALELNKTTTHTCILSSIELEPSSEDFFDYVDRLDVRLLKWANYIVFPTILTDITYLVKVLRLLHPHLQIVMHLDRNYHKTPPWHKQYEKVNSTVKNQLITNINMLDICICQNESLEKQYRSAVEFYFKDVKCHLTTMPTLISRISIENLEPTGKNESKISNIGVFNPSENFLKLIPILVKNLEKKGHNISYIIFDYKGDQSLYTNQSTIIFFKRESFLNYFQELLNLQLTIALFNVSEYSKYDPAHYYLEASAIGIPSIVCKEHPIASIVKDKEAGLLVLKDSDWETHITTLLEKEIFRKQLALHSMKIVWKDHSFTRKSLKKITSIFV